MSEATFFPHLHIHDDHSIKDGCASTETYADKVKELGGDCLAITNHGQAAGFARQFFTCKDRGIKPIYGMEAYINEHRLMPVREGIEKLKALVKAKTPGAQDKLARLDAFRKEKFRPSRHAIILARNAAGFRNLCRMSTDSWLRGFYFAPRTDTKFLAEHAEGLIYSTACIGGYIPRLAENDYEAGVAEARRLQGIFGPENFRVEIMMTRYSKQGPMNELMMKLAHDIGSPVIVTCDVHYSREMDREAQSSLLLMRDKKTRTQGQAGEGAWQFEAKDLYWKTLEDVIAIYKECHADYLPAVDFRAAIRNTYQLAEEIESVEMDCSLKLPGVFENPEAGMRELVIQGIKKRQAEGAIPAPGKTIKDYIERARFETRVIQTKSFSEYFLILHDICAHARSIGAAMGPGRGSAGGSLLAYLLGITQIDPLRFNLLFERFLALDRPDPPDIDLDFSPEHRDLIKDYVDRRYPATATIGTFSTFKPKLVIQDVGRVFEVPYEETLKVTKPMTIEADKWTWDQIIDTWPAVGEWAKKHPEAWEVVTTLRGLISHRGKSAAGVVIAPAGALDYMPLMKDPSDGTIVTAYPDTQGDGVKYKGREITSLGLLKVDILGVQNVNIVPRAVELVRRERGIELNAEALPFEDPVALKLASAGDVPGVFQFDTHTTRPILKKVGVDSFYDLAIITSLARPGPLESGLVEMFAKAKRRGERWKQKVPECLHESLKASRGLMIFQEDVMFTLQGLGGFSFVEANSVRKTISKKLDAETLNKYREKFIQGGIERGHDKEMLEGIFDSLHNYAKYAFNSAHAVAYSLTAAWQLYMLGHYPPEYFAALLAETPRGKKAGKTDDERIPAFIRSAMARGVKVLPPDVRVSGMEFDCRRGLITYGLSKIKGVAQAAEEIIERRKEGKFESLDDFINRVSGRRVNIKVLEALATAGALDRLPMVHDYDPESCEGVEKRNEIIRRIRELRKKKAKDDDGDEPLGTTESVLRDKERALIGIALSWWSSSQVDRVREIGDLWTISDAVEHTDRRRFAIVGEVSRAREHHGRRGKMAFLTMADETGTLENITVWSEQWKAYGEKLRVGKIAVVWLRRQENDGERRRYGDFSYFLDDRAIGHPPVMAVQALLRAREARRK